MHLDQERVHRFLHGELSRELTQQARSHLEDCESCRLRVEKAREEEAEILCSLKSLDHPQPTADLGGIVAKGRKIPFRPARWAAGVVFALAVTSGAYAAPGSPLPNLVRSLANQFRTGPQPSASDSPESGAEVSPSGIALAPGPRFSIRFSAHQVWGYATVELTDGSEVVVRALDGVSGFTAGIDRLLIENEGSQSDFEIQIPKSAPRVEIMVGKDLLFSKVGDQVTATIPADAEGRFPIPLHPPGF